MNIASLNLAEQRLMSQVESVTGLMEEKHEQLQQRGVFAEYIKIYEAYAELLSSESEGLEALKRAIFLCWYEFEPACFSGLFGLPEKTNRKVFEAIDQRIRDGELDLELKWLLPWYNMIADWVFSQYPDLKHLRSFLANAEPDMWQRSNLKAENFEDRGQMGKYWSSVIEARKRHPIMPQSNASSAQESGGDVAVAPLIARLLAPIGRALLRLLGRGRVVAPAATTAATAVNVSFGHGARHLAGTGLSPAAVESVIRTHVQQAAINASVSGGFWGRVVVSGVTIEYRAFTLANGTIHVGTYYKP